VIRPPWGVVIAARDEERHIGEAITSVLAQAPATLLDIAVVSDGSTDRTVEAARAAMNGRGTLIELEEGRGRAAARNLAASYLNSEFLVIADADDFSLPGRIEEYERLRSRFPAAAVFGGQALVTTSRFAYEVTRLPTDETQIVGALARGEMPLVHGSLAIRTDAFRSVGGYDERLVRAQDLHLLAKLALRGEGFAISERALTAYRRPITLSWTRFRHEEEYARSARELITGIAPSRAHTARHEWLLRNLRFLARVALNHTVRRERIAAVATYRREYAQFRGGMRNGAAR
jgi:glycosyltransferase involved in cell wall biosynthesis